MGYRSEVKSIVYGDTETMTKFIADNTELLDALQDDFDGDIETIEKPGRTFMFLSLGCVKWYDSYSEVARWMNLLNLADEADLKFEFIRVGEETSDIECRHSQNECDYRLNVVSNIDVNL